MIKHHIYQFMYYMFMVLNLIQFKYILTLISLLYHFHLILIDISQQNHYYKSISFLYKLNLNLNNLHHFLLKLIQNLVQFYQICSYMHVSQKFINKLYKNQFFYDIPCNDKILTSLIIKHKMSNKLNPNYLINLLIKLQLLLKLNLKSPKEDKLINNLLK